MHVQQRSPTLAGFKAVISRPSLGFAEIAWRWSFGFAAVTLIGFSTIEYLDSLPVTYRDELMFRTRQPALISRAISHILRGSSLRVIAVTLLLVTALSFAWMLLGVLGRSATARALLEHYTDDSLKPFRQSSLFGLNFLRASATLAAVVGCGAAFVAGGAASPTDDPSPGSAMMICVFIVILVFLAWSVLNWFLSLAAIFVVAGGRDTFGAIAAAVGLFRDRAGPLLAANTWFGLSHLVVFFVAVSVIGFPLAFAGLLPAGVVLGGVLVVVLFYFAIVDFLYVGRMAAYIAILKAPEIVPVVPDQAVTMIDRSELILSDLPNLLPGV
jgi:hypothetical protein